jgi:phage-related protein
MASDAEIDLLVNAANALPDLEDELRRIVNQAENSAPDVTLQAVIDQRAALAAVQSDIDDLVTRAQNGADDIDLDAALNQQASLRSVQNQLDGVIRAAQNGAPDIDLRAVLNSAGSLSSVRQGLRDIQDEAERAARIRVRVDVDDGDRGRIDGTTGSLGRLGSAATATLGPLGSLATSLGVAGAAAGGLLPLLGGVVLAAESVAPAAALGASAFLTLKAATLTLKVAMIGVEEAISAAFDPDASPEEFAEALERLSPEARDFATSLKALSGPLDEIRRSIQDEVFRNFGDVIDRAGKTVLPRFGEAARVIGEQLNEMGHQAATAAVDLGESGAFGTAINGSIIGLRNLERVPAQVVTAFGQIAAAAAPAFQRVTSAAGKAFDRISEGLSDAFESGALEDAIDQAVANLAQFGRVLGNIFEGIGNIFDAVAADGEGLFSVMETLSEAFRDLTADTGFQDALRALSEVMASLAKTAAPLLIDAFKIIGDVIVALEPAIQPLIRVLGEALGKVLEALGPVLVDLARVFGELVIALLPFVELAGELIAAVLPALSPLFETLAQIIRDMAPTLKLLAEQFAIALVPILEQLGPVLAQILPPFAELTSMIFPLLADLLVQISPQLAELATAFADTLVELAPVIAAALELAVAMAEELQPAIQFVIDIIAILISGSFQAISDTLNNVVIPALQITTKFLKGDFSGALEQTKTEGDRWRSAFGEIFDFASEKAGTFVLNAVADLQDFILGLRDAFVVKAQQYINELLSDLSAIPGEIQSFFEGLPARLEQIGRDAIDGLQRGIEERIAGIRSTIAEAANAISGGLAGLLDINSPSRVMMDIGDDAMAGLLLGLEAALPRLAAVMGDVAGTVTAGARVDPLQPSTVSESMALSPAMVQVFIGSERLDERIDFRVQQRSDDDDRAFAQGVRR